MCAYRATQLTLLLVGAVWSASAGASSPPELHRLLSPEELQEVFAVERPDDVPAYDTWHVRSVLRRAADGRRRRSVHVRAFDNRIDLALERNDELDADVPLFQAEVRRHGLAIERVERDTEMSVGELYQDVSQQAAVLVQHDADDGALLMRGVVGDLVVAPVPRRVRRLLPGLPPHADADQLLFMEEMDGEAAARRRRSVRTVSRGLHVIYRSKAHVPGSSGGLYISSDDFSYPESENADYTGDEAASRRRKREAPPDLFPEVLVVIDYETYKLHRFKTIATKRYLMAFMNAIDMRYRSVHHPFISVKIAGIVFSKSKEATPYLEDHMLDARRIDAASALNSMGQYLFSETRFPTYDAVLVITKRDMCTRPAPSRACNNVTAGYAYVGGGCSVSKHYNKVNSVAMVEDTGGFSGIIVATHELGHLMGVVHDGSAPPAYLGGPGARACAWEDGFIMSDLRGDPRGHQWSHCSVEQFSHFARDVRSRCMQNYPKKNVYSRRAARKMPGQLLDLDAQCKYDTGSIACFSDERVCSVLFCYEPSTDLCVATRPAADGSTCGRGMHCLAGHCKPKPYRY